ncbi:hypothetical protein Tco_0516133 [Tanacetum coccineum]
MVFGIKHSEMFEIGFHDEDDEFNQMVPDYEASVKKLAKMKEPTVKKTRCLDKSNYQVYGHVALGDIICFYDEMRAVLRRRKLMLKLWREELNTRHNLRRHSFPKVLVSPRHTMLLHKAYMIHSSALGTKRQEKDSQSVEKVKLTMATNRCSRSKPSSQSDMEILKIHALGISKHGEMDYEAADESCITWYTTSY